VNKMDLVDYDQKVFDRIETDFRRFLAVFQSIEPYFVPISALAGDNVVTRGENMPWFQGPSLLDYLERVPVGKRVEQAAFRLPVQRVVRPNHEFRGYAGTIASGHISPGDAITVLPSGRKSHVVSISTFDGDLDDAHAGQAVTLTLENEIDITRGDMIVSADHLPETATSVEAMVVWLNETPAELNKRYRLKHTTSLQYADLKSIEYRLNINTLDREPSSALEMNAIGLVRIETARPISFDPYQRNRATGSFILIDPATNATVAAGMISGRVASKGGAAHAEKTEATPVSFGERLAHQGHIGAVLHLGGRAELAWRLERMLFERGCTVFAFDSESAEISTTLLRLGSIVILTGASGQGFSIETAAGPIDSTVGTALPDSNSEALHVVERLLERAQILLPAPGWSDSGGI